MSDSHEDDREHARELFARYLAALEDDSQLAFDAWAAQYPGHALELRELYVAWCASDETMPSRADPTKSTQDWIIESGFHVFEELGAGATGTVYRALDGALRREVALKVIRGAALDQGKHERYLAEARLLAKLDHPNIVRIHSVEGDRSEVRLSLELIDGRTLQDIVTSDGPFAAEEAARIGIDLCRALAALHAQGLVHMDVKPGNVMRASGGRVVLLDFGYARASAGTQGAEASPVGGTPAFMSPEHFAGGDEIDARSDVYSLGLLLYWISSGAFPFEFQGIAELCRKVLHTEPIPLADRAPTIAPRFAAVVERALERRPENRYQSVGLMERDLRAALGDPVEAGGSTRRRVLAAGAALVALVALFAGRSLFAAPSFEIDCAFYRAEPGGDVRLEEGMAVAVGDKLYLRARASSPFYLYVFNEDAEGLSYCLFPTGDRSVPFEADVEQRLPGDDGHWYVSTPGGGAEYLFVVASLEPDAVAQDLMAYLPRPEKGEPLSVAGLPRSAREDLTRGVGMATPSPNASAVDGGAHEDVKLVDLFDAFERTHERSRVFLTRLRLAH